MADQSDPNLRVSASVDTSSNTSTNRSNYYEPKEQSDNTPYRSTTKRGFRIGLLAAVLMFVVGVLFNQIGDDATTIARFVRYSILAVTLFFGFRYSFKQDEALYNKRHLRTRGLRLSFAAVFTAAITLFLLELIANSTPFPFLHTNHNILAQSTAPEAMVSFMTFLETIGFGGIAAFGLLLYYKK